MLHFGKIPKKIGKICSAKLWQNLRNFGKKQQKIQQFLTKILRLESGFDSKAVQRSALCRSRRELSNEYLLAKFGLDTAENEPIYFCLILVVSSDLILTERSHPEVLKLVLVTTLKCPLLNTPRTFQFSHPHTSKSRFLSVKWTIPARRRWF